MGYRKTSIIILAYKEPEKFKKMFETLLNTTHQEETPYEIIVVGNDTDIEIEKYLLDEKWCKVKNLPENKIVLKDTNLGTSKGFNLGGEMADGYYLCFFNSDYYMMDNWLKSMIDCFEHQPNIGLCSCCTNASGNEDEKTFVKKEGDKYLLCTENDYKESDCAIAQMFTTKKIWEEVGGFGEQFYPVTFEDLDMSLKIKEKGYRIFVNRKCFGYHDYDMSKGLGRKKIMDRNRKLFKEKWGEKANQFCWA